LQLINGENMDCYPGVLRIMSISKSKPTVQLSAYASETSRRLFEELSRKANENRLNSSRITQGVLQDGKELKNYYYLTISGGKGPFIQFLNKYFSREEASALKGLCDEYNNTWSNKTNSYGIFTKSCTFGSYKLAESNLGPSLSLRR